MISFKVAQYLIDVILLAVFFYFRYGASYRDLEEIMAERGVSVHHTTQRWSRKFEPVFKVDRMTKETIQNVQEKEPLA